MQTHFSSAISWQLWAAGAALAGVLLAAGPVAAQQPAQQPALRMALTRLPAAARKTYVQTLFEQRLVVLYARAGLARAGLSKDVLREALLGFYNLRPAPDKPKISASPVLTVVDLTRPSNLKRLWVVDVAQQKILFNTLVAHGKGTGDVVATAFSNLDGSEQSSLGFYRTGRSTYVGKHGLSLKLHGLDPGFNTNAEKRAVVVHGAEYVCDDFVKKHGHLGRSQGCPALPVAETAAIIQAIVGGSVLYLHGPAAAGYHSRWLDADRALEAFGRAL